jgi:hypothetical protein
MTTTSGFTSFTSISGTNGSSIVCTWDFSAALVNVNNAKYIYIFANDASNFMTTHVVPLINEETNLLNTTFSIDNLTLNKTYLLGAEVTVSGSFPSSPNIVYYSNTTQCFPTSTPITPNFILNQYDDDSFTIRLVDASGNTPEPDSFWDGYAVLTGVYVIYTINSTLITNYFPNDENNSIYSSPLTTYTPTGIYEVVVTTENINGRSPLTASQRIQVSNLPTEPTNLAAVELIAVDEIASHSEQAIFLSWDDPTYVGYPPLTHYAIYRDTALISEGETSTYINAGTQFVDGSYNFTDYSQDLVLGETYSYSVAGYYFDGSSQVFGPEATSNTVKSIIYPTCTLIDAIPGNESVTVTAESNSGGSSGVVYNFLCDESLESSESSTYTFNNLTDGTSYDFQVRAYSTSETPGYTTTQYESDFTPTPAASRTPYSVQQPITDFSSNPLDSDGNPMNGELWLTWTDPERNSIDAPFNVIITGFGGPYEVAEGVQQLHVVGLTNGVQYDFTATVAVPYDQVPEGFVYSAPDDLTTVVPFTNPDPVVDFVLTTKTTPTQFVGRLDYSFTAPSLSSGGLTIEGYACALYNVSNGGRATVGYANIDQTTSNYSGSVQTLFGQQLINGAQYEMTVQSKVSFNSNTYYSTIENSYGFTVPSPVETLTTSAIDQETELPDGNVYVSWTIPSSQDVDNSSYIIVRNNVMIEDSVTGLTYTDPNVVTGTSYTYEIITVMNNNAALHSTPVSSSPAIVPFVVPSQVLSITLSLGDLVGTTIDASWVEDDPNGSGLPSDDLIYQYTLTDVSGNVIYEGTTRNNNYTFEDLTCGTGYVLSILSGVVQLEINYFNQDAISSTIYTSAAPTPPTNLTLQSFASGSITVNWVNSTAPTGLTFVQNNIYVDGEFWDFTSGPTVAITNLTDRQQYLIGVSEVYADNNPIQNLIESSQITGYGTPLTVPGNPLITAVSTNYLGVNGTQLGKTVIVTWYTDVNYPNCLSTLTRTIWSPTGSKLGETKVYELGDVDVSSNGVNTYIDDGLDDLVNALNGNTRTYSVSVVYESYAEGVSFYSTNPVSASAIPYDVPFPSNASGVRVDLSNCIYITDMGEDETFTTCIATLNTNGHPLITVDAVGLDGTSTPIVMKWNSLLIKDIVYSNQQIDSITAANQVAQLTLVFNPPMPISDILGVFANLAGNFVVSSPKGGYQVEN